MSGVCRLCRGGALHQIARADGVIVLRCSACRAGQATFTDEAPGTEDEYDRLYSAAMRDDKPEECWRLSLDALGEVAGRRILDVGCGRGAFLDCAKAAGMVTTGLEPSAEARRVAAARHQVIPTAIDDLVAPLPSGAFDVVTMWDVLEHVRDPGAALRAAIAALAPGGRLLVATPAMGTFFDRVAIVTNRLSAGRARTILDMCWTHEHLTRFDPESLRREVRSHGCSRVDVRPLLLLSLRSDRYATGELLPAWTRSERANRLISRIGVALARRARLHNKVLLEATR